MSFTVDAADIFHDSKNQIPFQCEIITGTVQQIGPAAKLLKQIRKIRICLDPGQVINQMPMFLLQQISQSKAEISWLSWVIPRR